MRFSTTEIVAKNQMEGQRPRCPRTMGTSSLQLSIQALLAFVLCASAFPDDLTQLYEKAYFLETAKGRTEEALDLYEQIATADASKENRQTIIQSLERMLVLHKRQRDTTLQDKVDHFELAPDVVDRVINTFGEPAHYVGGGKVCSRTNLPSLYTMEYPDGFSVAIMSDKIQELRFQQPNYTNKGIKVGSTLEEVIAVFPPRKTIPKTAPAREMRVEKGTLYKNYTVEGTATYNTGTGIRFFFINGKVSNLAISNPNWPGSSKKQ